MESSGCDRNFQYRMSISPFLLYLAYISPISRLYLASLGVTGRAAPLALSAQLFDALVHHPPPQHTSAKETCGRDVGEM